MTGVMHAWPTPQTGLMAPGLVRHRVGAAIPPFRPSLTGVGTLPRSRPPSPPSGGPPGPVLLLCHP